MWGGGGSAARRIIERTLDTKAAATRSNVCFKKQIEMPFQCPTSGLVLGSRPSCSFTAGLK